MRQADIKNFAILIDALLHQIEVIDRYGAALAIGEACETFSGVMAETAEVWAKIEVCKDPKLKKWMEERGTHERFYAGHFSAIHDVLRLSKLVTELIEQRRDLIADGAQNWLDELQGKPLKDAQATDNATGEQLNTSEEKTEETANSEEITQKKEYYF